MDSDPVSEPVSSSSSYWDTLKNIACQAIAQLTPTCNNYIKYLGITQLHALYM